MIILYLIPYLTIALLFCPVESQAHKWQEETNSAVNWDQPGPCFSAMNFYAPTPDTIAAQTMAAKASQSREITLDKENYKFEEKLGSGSFGRVYSLFKRVNGQKPQKLSLKIFKSSWLGALIVGKFKYLEKFFKHQHPGILRPLSYGSKRYRSLGHWIGSSASYAVFEHLPLDLPQVAQELRLFSHVVQEKPKATIKNRLYAIVEIYNQILTVIDFAKSHNMVHADLSPKNIMIDYAGIIQIIDAESWLDIEDTKSIGFYLLPPRVAPERMVLKENFSDPEEALEKSKWVHLGLSEKGDSEELDLLYLSGFSPTTNYFDLSLIMTKVLFYNSNGLATFFGWEHFLDQSQSVETFRSTAFEEQIDEDLKQGNSRCEKLDRLIADEFSQMIKHVGESDLDQQDIKHVIQLMKTIEDRIYSGFSLAPADRQHKAISHPDQSQSYLRSFVERYFKK